MGKRGEGWLVVQLILQIMILVAPRNIRVTFPPLLRYVGLAMLGGAVLLGFTSIAVLGRNLSPFPKPIERGRLVTSGPYRLVRHPIYFSLIVGAPGLSLFRNSSVGLGLSLLLFAVLDSKVRYEERHLMDQYPEYELYRRRVKRLLPWIY